MFSREMQLAPASFLRKDQACW